MGIKISGIASIIPDCTVSSTEVTQRIMQSSPGIRFPSQIIETITGIKRRHYVEEWVNTSDLAAEACRRVLAKTQTDPAEIDLLIFASAGQDLIEPATSHIVQAKIGTSAPVMDVKNACNSFINGVQVAQALMRTGGYRKALVAVGETPSKCIKWCVKDRTDLRLSFPGYTFGDAGAAALLEVADHEPGIFYSKFKAVSKHWSIGTLPGGGSMHPRGEERYSYFSGDGTALKDVFVEMGMDFLCEAFAESHTCLDDFAHVLVHQVTIPFLHEFLRITDIPLKKVIVTLPEYGNMAAASLPVAFDLAQRRGEIQPGDKILLVGLAGGISVGVMMFQY